MLLTLQDKVVKLILLSALVLLPLGANAGSLNNAIDTSASALKAQSARTKVIAENIANSETTGLTADEDPYRRKVISFKTEKDRKTGANLVKVRRVNPTTDPFKMEYRPGHPAANAEGYVKMPNVTNSLESMDLRQAQRSYEANLSAIETSRNMNERALDLLR
jgi:flagellar basal-body rod protein FlgC